MKLTLTTIFLVSAIAAGTWLTLAAFGVDIAGNDCRYYEAVGTVCY